MPIPQELLDQILGQAPSTIVPKRGEEIFEGTDYPHAWDGFVGQEQAKLQLQVQLASARARGTRIEHTLLASGLHGVGKSTLAAMVAYHAGVGITQTTGPLTVGDAQSLLQGMEPRDILFIDEAHLLTSTGRNKADWLLPLMTEGRLYTANGAQEMPDIAIIAATTDAGRLPQTLISRFMVQPTITAYSAEEAAEIAGNLAGRMGVGELSAEDRVAIAMAADANPRVMRQILTQVRDLQFSLPESHPNLDLAFRWAGVAEDGLSVVAREILMLLAYTEDHVMSQESLQANLNEPGPIRHHEQQLLQRGMLTVTGRGRKITDAGLERARVEAAALRA